MRRINVFIGSCILALVMAMNVWSQDQTTYKILYVNSATIKIDNQNIKEGDVFTYPCEIKWDNEKQAFRAIDIKSGRQQMFFASARENSKKGLVEQRRMSTRNESIGLERDEIAKLFGTELCMLDTVVVSTPLLTDEAHFFRVLVKTVAINREYRLPIGKKGDFILPRDVLTGKKNRVSRHIKLDIEYCTPDDVIQIVTDVQINVLPLNL